MTKIEEVKVETIEDTKQLKWAEKIETIYPETLEVPTYDYWFSQNTIDWEVAIRNLPTWWGKYFVWSSSRNSWATWNQVITWVWFKPKLVLINAIIATTPWGASWGQWDWITQYCSFTYQDSGNQNIWSYTSKIINAETNIYTDRATLVSLDNDWFTLNWSQINQWCNFQYQCFW